MQTTDIPQKHFANISRRTQAVIIDSLFLFFLFLGTSFLASKIDISPYIKVGIIGFLVLFTEPLLVTFHGASVGHHMKGLRIKNARTGKNLNIFFAFIRFILKSFIGLFSLIFVLTTKRHQALHDMISNSVVVMSPRYVNEGYEGLSERDAEQEGYLYPSKLRRLLIIILYLALFLVLSGVIFIVSISLKCLDYNICNSTDRIIEGVFNIVFTIMLFVIIVFGWRGKLFGARRKLVKPEPNMSQ